LDLMLYFELPELTSRDRPARAPDGQVNQWPLIARLERRLTLVRRQSGSR
jgi:hypothetical protein